jgi:pimeloyl-ACP methyl ester carboxylesterase
VRVAYTEWGEDPTGPLVVCVGGVANTAMRFNYLASDLEKDFRVVCMDWVGRGRSGWMADQRDYSLGTYVEQLKQLIGHLGGGPVILLGSSSGGSAAIELTAALPEPGKPPHPERHRALHPEEAPQAPLRDARSPLRVPRSLGPAAQDRRLAEERRARSATTSAST